MSDEADGDLTASTQQRDDLAACRRREIVRCSTRQWIVIEDAPEEIVMVNRFVAAL